MFRWVLCCWRLCCALMHWLSETKYQSVIISAGVVDLLSSSLRRCERLSLILKLVFSLQRSYRFGLFVCAFTVRLVIRNKSHRYDCRVTAIESMIKFSVLLSANRVGFRHLPYALKIKKHRIYMTRRPGTIQSICLNVCRENLSRPVLVLYV